MNAATVSSLHSDDSLHVFHVAGIGYYLDAYLAADCSRYVATISGVHERIIAETLDASAEAFRQLCAALLDDAASALAAELALRPEYEPELEDFSDPTDTPDDYEGDR